MEGEQSRSSVAVTGESSAVASGEDSAVAAGEGSAVVAVAAGEGSAVVAAGSSAATNSNDCPVRMRWKEVGEDGNEVERVEDSAAYLKRLHEWRSLQQDVSTKRKAPQKICSACGEKNPTRCKSCKKCKNMFSPSQTSFAKSSRERYAKKRKEKEEFSHDKCLYCLARVKVGERIAICNCGGVVGLDNLIRTIMRAQRTFRDSTRRRDEDGNVVLDTTATISSFKRISQACRNMHPGKACGRAMHLKCAQKYCKQRHDDDFGIIPPKCPFCNGKCQRDKDGSYFTEVRVDTCQFLFKKQRVEE